MEVQLDKLCNMSQGRTAYYLSSKAFVPRCSVKMMFLGISQNSHENTCARVSLLIKLQAEACNFIKKETLAQVLSCEFSEISKNTFFIEDLCLLLLSAKKIWF